MNLTPCPRANLADPLHRQLSIYALAAAQQEWEHWR
jgi:hypothetical protein